MYKKDAPTLKPITTTSEPTHFPRMKPANKQTGDPIYNFRKHKLTAMYEIRNLFPYNIGSTQLNNDTSRAMTLTVGFLYERYRVAVEDDFTDDGRFKFRNNTAESQRFLPNLVNTSVGDF